MWVVSGIIISSLETAGSTIIKSGSSSSEGSNKSSIIASVGILKSKNGSIFFMSLIMSLDVSIMSPLSLLSKISSSIQMSSVTKFWKGLFLSTMSSTKSITSVCFFCSAAASFILSYSAFNLANYSFVACVSISVSSAVFTWGDT